MSEQTLALAQVLVLALALALSPVLTNINSISTNISTSHHESPI